MNNFYDPNEEYLMHYGVKGMKWGKRKAQPFSVKATGHRVAAKVYDINEKFYSKNNRNKTMASMNRSAKNASLKKAEQAQAATNAKKAARQAKKERGRSSADKVLAKNAKVKDAMSFKAAGHKAYAKMFEVNEKFYSKNDRNKSMAAANRNAKEQQLRKAEAAQAEANRRKYSR